MQEIKCPKCGEVFQVDESGYAAIVRQVRDKEFEKELSERKAQYLSEKENAVLLAQTQTRQELAEEISRLQAKLAAAESARQLAEADARSRQEKLLSEQEKALSLKDAQISLLNAKITSVQETADKDIALAVSKAAAQKEKQINEMDRQIYDLTADAEGQFYVFYGFYNTGEVFPDDRLGAGSSCLDRSDQRDIALFLVPA